jgi:hypothetical protein
MNGNNPCTFDNGRLMADKFFNHGNTESLALNTAQYSGTSVPGTAVIIHRPKIPGTVL